MQVDRSRFLLLTASLAAAACDPKGSATPDTGGVDPARADAEVGHDTAADRGNGNGSTVWLEIEPGTEDPSQTPLGRATCDNTVGETVACKLSAPPSPHCESFWETERVCQALPTSLQPRSAEAAIECLNAASGTDRICDWNVWQDCVNTGVQAACIDHSTRPTCEMISHACGGGVDIFACQQAFAAVPPHNVSRVESCVREFCELSHCVVDLSTVF